MGLLDLIIMIIITVCGGLGIGFVVGGLIRLIIFSIPAWIAEIKRKERCFYCPKGLEYTKSDISDNGELECKNCKKTFSICLVCTWSWYDVWGDGCDKCIYPSIPNLKRIYPSITRY